MNYLPKARTENIVVQALRDEVLIYDLNSNRAFCLNETAAKVFNHCEGQTTFAELKAKEQLTDEIIFLALDTLKKENLLDQAISYQSPFSGMSRREIIRQVGLATALALPVISALAAPTAAHAASPAAAPCVNGGTLQPGAAFTDICASSTPTCDANAGGRCCSGRAVTSSVPCPINPGVLGACICAPPLV